MSRGNLKKKRDNPAVAYEAKRGGRKGKQNVVARPWNVKADFAFSEKRKKRHFPQEGKTGGVNVFFRGGKTTAKLQRQEEEGGKK